PRWRLRSMARAALRRWRRMVVSASAAATGSRGAWPGSWLPAFGGDSEPLFESFAIPRAPYTRAVPQPDLIVSARHSCYTKKARPEVSSGSVQKFRQVRSEEPAGWQGYWAHVQRP